MPGTHVASRLVETTALLSAGGAASLLSAFNARAQAEPTRRCASAICRSPTPRRCWWRTTTACSTRPASRTEAHAAAQLGAGDRGLHLGTGQRGAPAVAHDRLGALRQSGAGQGGGLEPRRRLGPDGDAGDQQRQDLGGKTVAIPFWYSIHNVVLQYLLRENGLTPVSRKDGAPSAGEVNLIVMAPADMPPALARSASPATSWPSPSTPRPRRWAWAGAAFHRRRLAQPRLLRGVHARARPGTAAAVVAEGGGRHRPGPTLDPRQPRGNRQAAVQGRHQPLHAARPAGPEQGAGAAAEDRERYLASGAIRHGDWDERRIDFQPYPSRATPRNWCAGCAIR